MKGNLTAEEIWKVEEGEIRRPGVPHYVIAALLMGTGAAIGTTGISGSVGFGVTFFWPAIAIQIVGGIWFGLWGGLIAGGLFPIISNMISGGTPPLISILWIPANIVQGMLTGIVFRKLRLDPRLTRPIDYVAFILVGGILSNIPGALYGPWIGRLFGLFTDKSYFIAVLAWFLGNSSCAIIFGIILLRALSPIVVNTKFFCKGLLA